VATRSDRTGLSGLRHFVKVRESSTFHVLWFWGDWQVREVLGFDHHSEQRFRRGGFISKGQCGKAAGQDRAAPKCPPLSPQKPRGCPPGFPKSGCPFYSVWWFPLPHPYSHAQFDRVGRSHRVTEQAVERASFNPAVSDRLLNIETPARDTRQGTNCLCLTQVGKVIGRVLG
jgi:hypothetical protein